MHSPTVGKSRLVSWLFGLLLTPVLLFGCAQTPDTPASTSAPAATPSPTAAIVVGTAAVPTATPKLERVSVRLDWFAAGYHAPFFLAIDKGWYKEQGLDVDILDGKGSTTAVQFAAQKNDTFGFAEGAAVIRSIASGMPVRSVATIYGDTTMAVSFLKSSGITKPKDLEGKRMATLPGRSAAQIWPLFVKLTGIDDKTITRVSVDAATKDVSVLSGQVDFCEGFAGGESNRFSLAGKPGGEFLFRDYGVSLVGYTLVANTDLLKEKPDVVRRFLAVTRKAWDYSRTHEKETVGAMIRFRPEQTEKSDYQLALMKGTFQVLESANTKGKPVGWQSDKDWQSSIDTLISYGDLKNPPRVDQVFTNEFLPQ